MNEDSIILKSKKNNNIYFLYDSKIIVNRDDINKVISIPSTDNTLCFYDIYYEEEKIVVIVASRQSYDNRYYLNEDTLELHDMKLSK